MGLFGQRDTVEESARAILDRAQKRPVSWIYIGGEYEYDNLHMYQRNQYVELQEMIRADRGAWAMCLEFLESVEDGKLRTKVGWQPHLATIEVKLDRGGDDEVTLARLSYTDTKAIVERATETGTSIKSRATIQFVREWVRRMALPELDAAAAQRRAQHDHETAEETALRKKYLP